MGYRIRSLKVLLGVNFCVIFAGLFPSLSVAGFTEVSSSAGVADGGSGMGVAVGDYDNDGDPDIYLVNNNSANKLYRNNGDGTFTDVAASAGVNDTGAGAGAAWGDYDADGDLDLYLANNGPNRLYRNNGNGTFTDVAPSAGVDDGGNGQSVAWGDYDKDGDPDLYLANSGSTNKLYRNNGNGTFADVTSSAGPTGNGVGHGVVFFDYDGDDDLDLYLANDGNNRLYRNDNSAFYDAAQRAGVADSNNGEGVVAFDYDNDGDLDLYLANSGGGSVNRLYRNNGNATFTNVESKAGVNNAGLGRGVTVLDYDHDGNLDIYLVNSGSANKLYRNNGNGTFTDVAQSLGVNDTRKGVGVAALDYDGDGDVDVYLVNEGLNRLYRNDQNDANFLFVRPLDASGHFTRHSALVSVFKAGTTTLVGMRSIDGGSGYLSQNAYEAHFGVDASGTYDISVTFPGGTVVDKNTDLSLGGVSPGGVVEVFGDPPPPTTTYIDVTVQVGLVPSHDSGNICEPALATGAAWADYDNDGDIDLYVTDMGGPNRLYRNDGDTDGDGLPNFTDVAGALSVDDPTDAGLGAVFIDYDNDGDQDLHVTTWGNDHLYQNLLLETGAVGFTDVTAIAGVGDNGRAITAAWGDFDGDGYLDMYLAKHLSCWGKLLNNDRLFHNNGDGTFTDVTGWLCGGIAPCAQVKGLGFTAGWFDYDNDGDLDLYLVNDNIQQKYYPNVLWRNDGPDGSGGWVFTDVSALALANQSINGMGLGVGDYDNDGWLDLAFSNIGPNYLLRNRGDGTFEDVSAFAGIQRATLPNGGTSITWGTVFFDYDNNSWLDLFIVAGYIGQPSAGPQPNVFFKNNLDGTFTDISIQSGLADPGRGRHASIVDFDGDGYLDLFVVNYDEFPILLHNRSRQLGNTNNWLTVTVEGTVSNRDGIGTRLWLTTPDGLTQMREINSGPTYGGGDYRAAYFGLGAHLSGTLLVRWPTGVVENQGSVTANQKLHLVEGQGIAAVPARLTAPIPKKTALLPSYPSPSNPETWIPYRLAEAAQVQVTIYDIKGQLVRTIDVGHQPVGVYVSKDKAIYWDGRNERGERVASGIYFYTLTANGFTATRKLLIRK